MTENFETIRTEIIDNQIAAGYSPTSDFIRDIRAARVEVDGDCCLVMTGGTADFFRRREGGGWGYRHSYKSPRRPGDAARYLRHGREVTQPPEMWLCSGCEEAGSILPGHFACGF